jgi:hypothetical protein
LWLVESEISQDLKQSGHKLFKRAIMGSKSKIWVIAGIVFVVIVVFFSVKQLQKGSEYLAVLYVDDGDVEVMTNGRWQTAINEMSLGEEDRVRTLDGEATLLFSDTIITSLEPYTEISIKEISESNVAISQSKGSTWNKFLSITGIKSFDIETPSTVATVRGTEFGIDVSETEEAVMVAEGVVLFGEKRAPAAEMMKARRGEKLVLGVMEKMAEAGKEMAKEMPDMEPPVASEPMPVPMAKEVAQEVRKGIQRQQLSVADKERMVKGVVKTIDKMKIMRERQLEKNPELKAKLMKLQERVAKPDREPPMASEPMPEEGALRYTAPSEPKPPMEPITVEEALDRLAAMRPELMERLKAMPEDERRARMEQIREEMIIKMQRLQEQEGMQGINVMNEKINAQLELLQELQASDKEMDEAAHRVFKDPDFKEIVEPLAEADAALREQLIESRAITEERMRILEEEERLENIRRALEQEAEPYEEPHIIKEMPREEPMPVEEPEPERRILIQAKAVEEPMPEPIHVWTPEGEFLEYPDGRMEPVE